MKLHTKGSSPYRQICNSLELEPINFHYYILNLSQEQLETYNEQAKLVGGQIEYEIY